ncbi:drug resistance MFS transporter, drug:H+ antiporter-2 (14 Spanner) (DHA2) family [compost metagenome]
MALLPPFMQNLMGYPVPDVGYVLAPRGLGTMVAVLLVGRLITRMDPRPLITIGLLLTSLSLWEMTLFTVDSATSDIIRTGVTQGLASVSFSRH